jgi:hypothetical protein
MSPKYKQFMVIIGSVFIPLVCIIYITYVFNSDQTFDPATLFAKQVQTLDSTCIKSDFNSDGLINGADLSALLNNWDVYDEKYDIWGKTLASDGVINTFDLSRTIYCWMLTKPPECGDNKKDITEECDPPGNNSSSCPSKYCSSSCKCMEAPTPTLTPVYTIKPTPLSVTQPPVITSTPVPSIVVDNGTCQCHATGTVCGKLGILEQCIDYDETQNMTSCVKQSACTAATCCSEAENLVNAEAVKRGATISSFTCNATPTFINTCN